MNKNFQICIVGWSFPSVFYLYLSKSKFDIYIVAHRYSKILDDLKLNYTVTKNIGVEFGAYDWYIKNIWDGKSNVLFMHDDTKPLKGDPFKDIFKKCSLYDYVYILSKNCRKGQVKSNRGFVLSKDIIKILLNKYNGFWYDKYNRGYIVRDEIIYDKRYTEEYRAFNRGIGKKFKETILYLKDKYKLKCGIIKINNIYFDRSMQGVGEIKDFLADHSIFNDNLNNKLEFIAIKEEDDRRRDNNYYTKWYHYYFKDIHLNNFNVIEIGGKIKSIKIWKKYFKNSNIYNINNLHNVDVKKFCDSIEDGVDIIIDNGKEEGSNRKKLFELLFDDMNNWGVYILENLHKNRIEDKEVIDFLSKRLYDMNYNGKFKNANLEKNIEKSFLNKYEKEIMGISFHPGICFVFKNF